MIVNYNEAQEFEDIAIDGRVATTKVIRSSIGTD